MGKTLFRIIRGGISLAFAFALLSCRSEYPRPEFAETAVFPSTSRVLSVFRNDWPDSGVLRHSAVLEFRGGRVSALGICSFDADTRDTALAMLTTTGVKILQVSSKGGDIRGDFRITGVRDKDKAARNLILDVEGTFIHPSGEPDARGRRGNSLLLSWMGKGGAGTRVELVFGVPRGRVDGETRLMEKFFYKGGTLERAVFYYDYSGDGALPSRIRVENYSGGYYLTLKAIAD